MSRPSILRTAAAVVLAGAALVLPATSALAGTQHAITTAPSPSTGDPIAGGGSWVVNKPSGYYVGRALPGDTFDNEVTTSGNWHYGRTVARTTMCGWVMPGSMGADRGTVPDTCSDATRATISHRMTVGRDYNARSHDATDGTEVPADTGCTLSLNYFYGTDFTSNGGHWADAVGAPAATVRYRFTTRDGAAAVVRDPVHGWGFLPLRCVQRPTQLFNDDD